MGRDAPLYKGVLIDHDYVKDTTRAAFMQAAKGKVDEVLGKFVNDLERYMAAELLLNTREVIKGVRDQLDNSLKFLEEFAGGIDEKILQRRAEALARKEEGQEPS